MRNKRGFTLAELLGVIVILLLLVLIVTPIFINYSKKASKSAYEVQINTIKESAREWALDEENIKLLPTKEDECVKITLEKLKELGLLDYNITNPKTNEKFADESVVIIRKVGSELTYTFDEDGTTTCETEVTVDYPRWVFISSTPSVAGDTDTVTVNIKSDRKISEESLDPEDITVKVGGQIIDDAVVTVSCSGVEPLTCELNISNLDGDGKLSLVIDKETMKDEDLNPSRITNIQTNTTIDTSGPKITYTGKTNTNSSIYYATKDDTVVIKFKAEDNGEVVNELTAEDIIVYLDGVEITCGKSLTTNGSGTKVNYELTLTNVEGSGKVSIKIPTGKIKDNRGNLNNEKIISPGITYDNIAPEITFSPNGSNGYVRDISVKINARDDETGVNEETLKYIFTTDINGIPNVAIANGGRISKDSVTGDYYIIGYVCDYAGNCATVPSNIYQMNNSAPEIVINPDGNSGYEKDASIKIKVTSHGEAIDEGSLKYIVSQNINATPSKNFTNNQNITIDNLSGVYYVIAEACDITGLCTTKTSQEFYFDNEAPTVTYTPNGTYTNGAYYWTKKEDVTINVTDNVAVDWAKYKMSTSKTATPDVDIENGTATKNVTATDATKTLYLITKACDNLGNCKTSVSNKYQIDKTKPTIGSKVRAGNVFTINVSDDIELARYEIYNSSGTRLVNQNISGASNSITYTQNTAGTYTVKLYDHVGNVSEDTFVVPSYTITFVSANVDTGTVSPASKTANYGASVTSTATPSEGYKTKSVSGTGCSLDGNTVKVNSVTGDTTCIVTFALKTYKVTFQSNDTNMGNVSPAEVTVNYGGSATTTATPVDGYKYKSVSCNNGTAGYNEGTITTSNVTGSRTCTVTFEASCAYSDNTTWNFSYGNSPQEFNTPCDGTYKLEVWGAQGGGSEFYEGGKGGYSYGNVTLSKNDKLYVVTGGQGTQVGLGRSCGSDCGTKTADGGYNGGGKAMTSGDYTTGSGGGATHIGTFNSTLASHGSTSGLYIVAGGGGGADSDAGWTCGGAGGVGGGSAGGSGNGRCNYPDGGTQSASTGTDAKYNYGSFGKGANYSTYSGCNKSPGGGGGLYGGDTVCNDAAGGGSGYIGGVTSGSTSSGSKTFTDPNGTSVTGHAGNGYARITLVTSSGGSSTPEEQTIWSYDYSGKIKTFTAPKAGRYFLEVCGAQGADSSSASGGAGGKTTGTVTLAAGDKLYVVVGATSSYNGGGKGGHGGSGGGATHIATATGLLADLSSNKNSILVVGGGGGGGACYGSWCADGGAGGGTSGTAGSSHWSGGTGGAAGTQTTGYAFGQGGAGTLDATYSGKVGDGGGGYYGGKGGYAADGQSSGGGGGSGYVKSTVTGGQTTTGVCQGDGYAVITYLGA